MRCSEWTNMGGTGEAFLTTHWSLIEDIKSKEDRSRALIGSLLAKYWKPVYCYLRCRGYPNETAKDLTQGFFHEIVLNKNLVQRADQAKGRFRSFLLHALNQYLINEKQRESAQKRTPPHKLVRFDALDPPVIPDNLVQLDPEELYNYSWLSALLDEILQEMEKHCAQKGQDVHWKVFHARIVLPILQDGKQVSLTELCRKYGISDERKASNMVITIKRRFQAALREHVRHTVLAESQIADELRELMKFFKN